MSKRRLKRHKCEYCGRMMTVRHNRKACNDRQQQIASARRYDKLMEDA